MSDDRTLERAARSFIEAGPTRAPEAAVEAALLQIQTTPQERDWHVPRRTRPITMTIRLLTGAAAIALLLVGGALLLRPGANTLVGAPSPSASAGPTVTPSASPAGSALAVAALTQTFTSARYGYRAHYPSGWTVKDATKPWTALRTNNWGTGINDELNGATARFSGASMALAPGQTADQWITAYANAGSTSSWPTVTIGGQAGKIDSDGVPALGGTIAPGGVMFDAIVVTSGRAYNFNMDGKVDRATFEAFLASVTLDPGSVVVVPPLTQAFSSARHGFSIKVPATWSVKPATAPWPAGTAAAAPPDPMLDVFTPGSLPIPFVVVSSPLARDVTADAWLAAYEKSAPQMPAACWPLPGQMERTTIDRQPAWIHGGLEGCGFTEAVTFAGGRVYEFTGYHLGSLEIDRGLFLDLIGTVKLDPAGADDTPTTPAAS